MFTTTPSIDVGGSECRPSGAYFATRELWVALQYPQGFGSNSPHLAWLHTDRFMDSGVDLQWISAFPHEKEFLYPPPSFLRLIRPEPTMLKIGAWELGVGANDAGSLTTVR